MYTVDQLPYLTQDIPGIGGQLKSRPEDFIVDEIPLYEPCGEGTHVYFRIEKRGIATMAAVREIARALDRSHRDIGYAGLKDADAVTTQTLSIEHIDPTRIEQLDLPRIRVVDVSRHGNKLKLGHLRGNRFCIRVRGVDTSRVDEVRSVIETLVRRGVPNYFGAQRFGLRGDTWLIGRAMLMDDFDEALAVMLGRPSAIDYGRVAEARRLFDQGEFEAAAREWRYPFRNERSVCLAMARSKGNARRAFRAVDAPMRRFYISAYQSQLFNQIVAQRLNTIDQLQTGDLAWIHAKGAVFRVEDRDVEQPRCEAFEISPSGPLFGRRMSWPSGEPERMERTLLASQEMDCDTWREGGKKPVSGGRRPLRFQPRNVGVDKGTDQDGAYLEFRFALDSGCYATTVLREIMKTSIDSEA